MSNTVLALHARYGVPTGELLRRNRIFGAQMLILCVAVLYCYERVVRLESVLPGRSAGPATFAA